MGVKISSISFFGNGFFVTAMNMNRSRLRGMNFVDANSSESVGFIRYSYLKDKLTRKSYAVTRLAYKMIKAIRRQ